MNVNLFTYDHRGTRSKGVEVAGLRLWFSYETCIAFQAPGCPRIVRENSWGPTTGHHLASVDGGSKEAKKARLSSEAFEAELEKLQVSLARPLRKAA